MVIRRFILALLASGGFALTALILIGSRPSFLHGLGQQVSNEVIVRDSGSVPISSMAHAEPSAAPSTLQSTPSPDAKADHPVDSSSVERWSNRPSMAAETLPQTENSRAGGSPPVEAIGRYSSAVIGRSFPVSASVKEACEHGSREDYDYCAGAHKILAKFSQEPRDLAWAPNVETRLRALIMAEPDKYVVRAIECRTTVCVAEATSIYGIFHYITQIASDTSLSTNLMPDMGSFGYETDPSMARITVTLMTFKRR